MSDSKKPSNLPLVVTDDPAFEPVEIFPGVRITRRLALRGTAASALMMALTASGCDIDDSIGDNEDDDESADSPETKASKDSGKKDKGSKKKKKDKDPSAKDSPADDSPEADSPEDESPESKDSEDEPKESEEESEDKPKEPEDEEDDSPLSLEEILSMVVDEAKELVADKSIDESAYQARVSKLLARLDKNTNVPKLSPGGSHRMQRLAGEAPIQVFVLEMAPNARIPLHDHGNRIGNLIGWRGSAKTTNYTRLEDSEGGGGPGGGFLLQETDSRDIDPGSTGFLARVENNFHIVEAGPKGAAMLDMFTYYRNAGNQPGAGSRFARLGQVVDKEKKIYRANYAWDMAHLSAHDFSDEV